MLQSDLHVATTFAYGDDAAGNRTSDSTATYTINDVNQITNTGYTYDANGNLTADGVNTYVWDAANRLTAVVYPSSAGRTDFTYDGLGRRVKLLEKNGAGTVQKTSNFIWSGMTITEERDSTNTVIKRFLPEGVQLPTGITPNNKLYYSKDHLGSVRSLSNSNGTILDTLDYDVYGGISRAPVPANDTSGAGPVLTLAASRMTQGTGTFDANLPLSGAPGIEMRSGGSYSVLLTFDRTVLSATSVTVASGVGSVASTSFSGNTATISLSGVSDRQTITLELDNIIGVVGVNTKVLISMSVLVGDVNQSGAVTIEDIALVTANTGVAVTGSTFKYDINHNGAINSSDISQIKVLGSQGSSLYPDFAFTGHFYHARSGLYLAPYRAYNPIIGRWLTRDPLKDAEFRDGPNLYVYVGNNPLGGLDPLGLLKIYGNWCGPNWTGRRQEPYSPQTRAYYAPPIDGLDAACTKHDICYYKCRQAFPCDPDRRSRCFRSCDDQLSNAAYAIGGFWGNVIGAAIDRPGKRDPEPNDPSCSCEKQIIQSLARLVFVSALFIFWVLYYCRCTSGTQLIRKRPYSGACLR